VQKNGILIHTANIEHFGERAAPCSFMWLHFSGELPEFRSYDDALSEKEKASSKKVIILPSEFEASEPERIAHFMTMINDYNFIDNSEYIRSSLTRSLLYELSLQHSGRLSNSSSDKRFSELISFINMSIKSDLRVSDLCERFGYNSKYLSRLFKKNTGVSIPEYITDRRIELAKKLLLTTTDTVTSIAREAGYSDEYYFMKVFKSRVGMTPKGFRRGFTQSITTK
jgi:YesN/AraC family two-component response regulator